ncbi:hypothetical protein TWF569_011912 [Orbilia oligospora]|uniref:Uncharacterized protein n=1 Tax=Orbilia oligospora TaxID=2813651 RepID=A0A7C8J940_ORBOL|nr:hypothetical protein TWF103_000701 [Orbilia oligospora]KAF3097422.1 hypothetical protein TWF102_006400 [Orbilia oligospora]KAF3126901.1 hypothetical protein TWF569_011912 [Orbilia oligospora]KAF3151039.1 hypothetical protein TWF594_008254 [Orbilia oligospora]
MAETSLTIFPTSCSQTTRTQHLEISEPFTANTAARPLTRPPSKKYRVHPYRTKLLIRWRRLCMINRFFYISNKVISPRWVSPAICSHAMRGYCDLIKLSR